MNGRHHSAHFDTYPLVDLEATKRMLAAQVSPSRGPIRSEAVTEPLSSRRQAARSELCR
jgi:hypothetical protein